MKLWTSNDPRETWWAVHRAVAVLKRHRSLVRADPDARQYLERLPQAVRIEPQEEGQTPNQQTGGNIIGGFHTYEEAPEIIDLFGRIMERATVKRNGSNLVIEVPAGLRLYVRKRPQVLAALAPWLGKGGRGGAEA